MRPDMDRLGLPSFLCLQFLAVLSTSDQESPLINYDCAEAESSFRGASPTGRLLFAMQNGFEGSQRVATNLEGSYTECLICQIISLIAVPHLKGIPISNFQIPHIPQSQGRRDTHFPHQASTTYDVYVIYLGQLSRVAYWVGHIF